jgi:hypothetical protein
MNGPNFRREGCHGIQEGEICDELLMDVARNNGSSSDDLLTVI